MRNHPISENGGGSKTFVAVDVAAPETILGYYSISPASIAFAKVSPPPPPTSRRQQCACRPV